MVKFYSESLLIRYLYNEADLFEKLEVEHALETDSDTMKLFKKLKEGISQLPKAKFFPSQASIDKILFASRNIALQA